MNILFVFNDIAIFIFIVLFFSSVSNKMKKMVYAAACIPYLFVIIFWGFDLSFWGFQDVTLSQFSSSAFVTISIIGYLQAQVDESPGERGKET